MPCETNQIELGCDEPPRSEGEDVGEPVMGNV